MDKTSTTNEETVDQTIRRLLDEQITNDHPNFNLDFDGDSDSDQEIEVRDNHRLIDGQTTGEYPGLDFNALYSPIVSHSHRDSRQTLGRLGRILRNPRSTDEDQRILFIYNSIADSPSPQSLVTGINIPVTDTFELNNVSISRPSKLEHRRGDNMEILSDIHTLMESSQKKEEKETYASVDNPYNRLYQTVYFGSVILALSRNFFSVDSLLRFLHSEEKEIIGCHGSGFISLMLAYKHLCILEKPSTHYIDGEHIVKLNPIFSLIYSLMGGDLQLEGTKGMKDPVIQYASRFFLTYMTNKKHSRITDIICDNIDTVIGMSSQEIELIIRGGDLKKMFLKRPRESVNAVESYIIADFVDCINLEALTAEVGKKILPVFIKRIRTLIFEAPLYFFSVVFENYRKFLVAFNKLKVINISKTVTDKDIILLNNTFPNILDCTFLKYSPLARAISKFNNVFAGYFLGFPIHLITPSREVIEKALTKLSEIGDLEYIKKIVEYNGIQRKTFPLSDIFQYAPVVTNTEDNLMTDVDNHFPFDIISSLDNGHLTTFTRSEWNFLLKGNKSPYTRQLLNERVQTELKIRDAIVLKFSFRNCLSIQDTYEKLLSNYYCPTDDGCTDLD